MAKITLINPAYGIVNKFGEVSMQYNKLVQPTCLAYIASMLKDKGHKADIIDANINRTPSNASIWQEIDSDIVVLTTASLNNWQCPYYPITPVSDIAKTLTKRNIKVIINGPHGTSNPEYIFEECGPEVIVVRGEPEVTTVKVIDALLGKNSLAAIPGIDYFDNGLIHHTKEAQMFDLNLLPIPAYDLLPMEKYKYEILGHNFALMEASRGCPYPCRFCLKNMYRNVFTNRDPKKVVEEMEYLNKNFNVKNIFFIDLEFTINRNKTIELCKEIINSGLKINWAIQARADHVDDELLEWMAKAGCKIIHFGVESGDPNILKATDKLITLDKIEDAFRRTREKGIKSLGYFLLGHPGETKEQIERTIEFAKKLNPDYASFLIIIPYPGTKFYRKPEDDSNICLPTASYTLSMEELEKLRKHAVREFYLRPAYIINKIKSIKTKEDISVIFDSFKNLFMPLVTNKS